MPPAGPTRPRRPSDAPPSPFPVQGSTGGPNYIAGISSLDLSNLGLSGTLPHQLRELRGATLINLQKNRISGTIPSCWGSNITWTTLPASTRGFDRCTALYLGQVCVPRQCSRGSCLGVSQCQRRCPQPQRRLLLC